MKLMWYVMALALISAMETRAADGIYVKMPEAVPCYLSSGLQITAEKGDCFPFVGYDGTQTLVEMKFDRFTFWTRKTKVEIVPEASNADAATKYQAAIDRIHAAAVANMHGLIPGMPGMPAMMGRSFGNMMPAVEVGSIVTSLMGDPLRRAIHEEVVKALLYRAGNHAVAAFPVDSAGAAWQNSGVRVRAGQHVVIEAAPGEMWKIDDAKTDAKGFKVAPPSTGQAIFHLGTEDTDWHWGALICAVGDGPDELGDQHRQMEVGARAEFKAKKDGALFFICNDSPELPNGANGFDSNSGIIHVKVVVTDEPGAPAAGAAGAAGEASPAGASMTSASGPAAAPTQSPTPAVASTGTGAPVASRVVVPGQLAEELRDSLRTIMREELWSALGRKGSDHFENTFPVDAASQAWQNSGVRVNAGDHVVVQVMDEDVWDLGWGPTDAKGYSYPPGPTTDMPVYHTGKANADWHWGALICAVGNSRSELDDQEHEVEVGLKRGFTVDNGGYLYFVANDKREAMDGRNGFRDNLGLAHVKITVTEPESAPAAKADATAHPAPMASPGASPAASGSADPVH